MHYTRWKRSIWKVIMKIHDALKCILETNRTLNILFSRQICKKKTLELIILFYRVFLQPCSKLTSSWIRHTWRAPWGWGWSSRACPLRGSLPRTAARWRWAGTAPSHAILPEQRALNRDRIVKMFSLLRNWQKVSESDLRKAQNASWEAPQLMKKLVFCLTKVFPSLIMYSNTVPS